MKFNEDLPIRVGILSVFVFVSVCFAKVSEFAGTSNNLCFVSARHSDLLQPTFVENPEEVSGEHDYKLLR